MTPEHIHHVVQFDRNLKHLSVESCCNVLKSYTPISHWQLFWTVLQKKKCIKIDCLKEKCFGIRQWVKLVIDNKLITFCALGATHHVVQFHRNLNHLSVESCCDVLKSYTPINHWQLPWTVLQKKKCIKIYCSKEKCFGKRHWVELVIDNKLITFCALGATHLLSELRRGRLPIKITFETSHVYWLMRRKLKGSQLNFNDRLQ